MNRKTVMILLAGALLANASIVDLMIGARGFGMGGAYVAIAADPSAAYWNPAGLGLVEDISLMGSNWIFQDVEGLNMTYANLSIPIKYVGTVAGSWLYGYARLEQMGVGGELESNSAGEHTFSLAIGRKLWDKLAIFHNTAVGFSINRHTFITNEGNGAGLGFDIGIQTQFPYGISFGVTGRSLGTDMMGDKIDPEVRFGLGWQNTFKEMHRVTVAADGAYKRNRDYQDSKSLEPAVGNLKGFGGLEYALVFGDWEVALRGGANGMALHNTLGSYGYSAGAGVTWLGYSVQYAFKGDTDAGAALGYSHRVDLVLQLNKLNWKKKEIKE